MCFVECSSQSGKTAQQRLAGCFKRYVCGGSEDQQALNSAERFNPARGVWWQGAYGMVEEFRKM